MATQRQTKYKRAQKNKPSLQLSDGDLTILKTVWRYRYITTPLLALVTGRHYKIINERTRKLFDHCYLGRLHLPHPRSGGGSSPSIHVIDEKGRRLLANEMKIPLSSVGTSPTTQKNPEMHLKHSLLISHIYAVVEAACNTQEELEFLFWHRENNNHRERVVVNGRRITVKPDAFFGVIDKKRPPDRQKLYFFLEADRSTMPIGDMVRKYEGYLALWNNYRRQPIPTFGGIRAFRVLTVTEKASDRIENLIKAACNATETGRGSNMFWFCNQDDIPIEEPQRFFKPVWRVGKKDDLEPCCLVES